MYEQTERIKKKIEEVEYVSFDIFDTLIVRPFLNPSDLFYALDSKFEKYMKTNISFHEIRTNGEDGARKYHKSINPLEEDITITDIYNFICKRYSIPYEICKGLMEKEKELEIRYAERREYVFRLYRYALDIGKKIVFCSDMYLEEETISSILVKNGITEWEKLFLSSKEKKLKRTGNMYDIMLNVLGCSPNEILHIGDDELSDIKNAQDKGIDTIFIPKTKLCFTNAESYVGSDMGLRAAGTLINYKEAEKSVGYRSMIAIVANRFFDNPFVESKTDKTIFEDAYNIGYYFLGMHVVGIVNWIVTNVKNYAYKKVYFLSRDGWLIKQAYDVARGYNIHMPPSDYLYVSREALLPAQIECELDFFDLPIEFKKYSPELLLEMLDFCTTDLEIEEKKTLLKNAGIEWDKKFGRIEDYQFFVENYIQYFYDRDKHLQRREMIKRYFNKIESNEVMFDMGYSGRIQCAINRLLEEQVDVFLIHSDSVRNSHLVRKGEFREHCFYDYSPAITGMLREYLLSETGPSCIGYYECGEEVVPLFETEEKPKEEKELLERMFDGAKDFVEIYYKYFADYLEYLPFKSQEVSLPFEGFLREAKENDYSVFQNCFSDDKIYGKNPAINIARFWRNRQKELAGEFVLKNKISEGDKRK